LNPCQQKDGGNNDRSNQEFRAPEKLRDVLMLSSFGFWALLLGLAPILIFHSLIS